MHARARRSAWHGRSSDPPDSSYRHCDDVRQVVRSLAIERACVGGQSFGGSVALDLAFAFPELVSGLIMAPTAPLMGRRWTQGSPVGPALKLARIDGGEAAKAAFLELPLFAASMENETAAATLRRLLGDYSGWHLRHRDPAEFAAAAAADRRAEIDVRPW